MFTPRAVDKLREAIETTQRLRSLVGNNSEWTPNINPTPAQLCFISSFDDVTGFHVGRVTRYDPNTTSWMLSDTDVYFMSTTPDAVFLPDIPYPCIASHHHDTGTGNEGDVYIVYPTGDGGGQRFCQVTDSIGTGTWNAQGRSVARLYRYTVSTDSWALGDYILLEPLKSGTVFKNNEVYPCWFAGNARGGYDGTGTGTIGTGTGGLIAVYLAEGHVTQQVVTNVSVACVGSVIITTQTKSTVYVKAVT